MLWLPAARKKKLRLPKLLRLLLRLLRLLLPLLTLPLRLLPLLMALLLRPLPLLMPLLRLPPLPLLRPLLLRLLRSNLQAPVEKPTAGRLFYFSLEFKFPS